MTNTSLSINNPIQDSEYVKGLNDKQERVLALLGNNYTPEIVSGAVGVSVSYISQLLNDPNFANEVALRRVTKLTAYTDRDNLYDKMEDKLAKQMDSLIPYMTRPMEVLRALKEMNAMKRRTTDPAEQINPQQTIVELHIPQVVLQQFTTNINNQVIKAGDQNLVTVQSASLPSLVQRFKQLQMEKRKEFQNVPSAPK